MAGQVIELLPPERAQGLRRRLRIDDVDGHLARLVESLRAVDDEFAEDVASDVEAEDVHAREIVAKVGGWLAAQSGLVRFALGLWRSGHALPGVDVLELERRVTAVAERCGYLRGALRQEARHG